MRVPGAAGGPAGAQVLAGEAGGGRADEAPEPRLWMATETARRARGLGTSRGGRAGQREVCVLGLCGPQALGAHILSPPLPTTLGPRPCLGWGYQSLFQV